MSNKHSPSEDKWYRDLVEDHVFKVVAVDIDEDTIEIQYFEGEIEELDFETWKSLMLVPIPAPEDWSGPFDGVRSDDMGDTDSPMHPHNWSDPLNEIE